MSDERSILGDWLLFIANLSKYIDLFLIREILHIKRFFLPKFIFSQKRKSFGFAVQWMTFTVNDFSPSLLKLYGLHYFENKKHILRIWRESLAVQHSLSLIYTIWTRRSITEASRLSAGWFTLSISVVSRILWIWSSVSQFLYPQYFLQEKKRKKNVDGEFRLNEPHCGDRAAMPGGLHDFAATVAPADARLRAGPVPAVRAPPAPGRRASRPGTLCPRSGDFPQSNESQRTPYVASRSSLGGASLPSAYRRRPLLCDIKVRHRLARWPDSFAIIYRRRMIALGLQFRMRFALKPIWTHLLYLHLPIQKAGGDGVDILRRLFSLRFGKLASPLDVSSCVEKPAVQALLKTERRRRGL